MESLMVGVCGSFQKLTSSSFPFPAAPQLLSSLRTGARVSRLLLHPCKNYLKYSISINRFQQQPCDKFLLYQKGSFSTKHVVNAGSANTPHEHIQDVHPNTPQKSILHAFDVFFRFLRVYAATGTVLSIISFSFLAAEKLSDFTPLFFLKTFEAIVAAFLMQIYVGGFNQLTDIQIDKVNKSYLPLASGELSFQNGVTIVSLSAIMSFLLAWKTGSWPLFWALFSWLTLGTGYSIDKKYPLMAALYIVAERALVVPVAFYIHAQTYIHGRPAHLSRQGIFATAMMTLFSVVITFFKDIPDIEGDQKYGIKSLAARLGPKLMFWSCIWFLEMAFGVAVLMGLSSSILWSKYTTVLGHALMALLLWTNAKSVDLKSKATYTIILHVYMEALLCRVFAHAACKVNNEGLLQGRRSCYIAKRRKNFIENGIFFAIFVFLLFLPFTVAIESRK